jgi:hypothetical protein
MRKVLAASLCVLAAVGAATAQSEKEEVLKAEAAFSDAKIHNDVKALDLILAPDYIGFNQWGARRDKPALLQLFAQFPTASLVPEHVSVRVSGDTATIDGIMSESSGGMQMKFLFLRTYVKRGGRWQLWSSSQSYRVDPETMKVTDPIAQ